MPDAAEILFWTCFLVIVYTYAGYPLILWLLTRRTKRSRPAVSPALPSVTLVVAAYNEETLIERKIRNCLALDYPPGLLRLIFVTDGSTDGSADLVRRYPQCTLLHEPGRRGKVAAINRAMPFVTSAVTVFTDANSFLNPGAITALVAHYGCPRVGGVAGEKRVRRHRQSVGQGEGLYWQYESRLKQLDSDLCTTVGAAGELFSISTSLYTFLPEDTLLDDFVQSLRLCISGYVVRYEPGAYAEEEPSVSLRDEMERKVRIAAGAFQAMPRIRPLFNPFRFPVICFQLVSHRILRWTLCPLALVGLLVCSVALAAGRPGSPYPAFLVGELAAYAAALAGWVFALKNRQIGGIYAAFYFVFMNFCVFAGFWRFLRGGQTVLWHRAGRPVDKYR